MRNLNITEIDKRNILLRHSLIKEDISTAEKVKAIQRAIQTKDDAIIGPDTTKKLVAVLKTQPTFDSSCVTSYPSAKKTLGEFYKIDDLYFNTSGTYYKDEIPFTYKCIGTTIETSNHGLYPKDSKTSEKSLTNTEKPINKSNEIKKQFKDIKEKLSHYTDSELMDYLKYIYGYTDEEITSSLNIKDNVEVTNKEKIKPESSTEKEIGTPSDK
jgi:hypothetical protein